MQAELDEIGDGERSRFEYGGSTGQFLLIGRLGCDADVIYLRELGEFIGGNAAVASFHLTNEGTMQSEHLGNIAL